jgi:hypothetical protein
MASFSFLFIFCQLNLLSPIPLSYLRTATILQRWPLLILVKVECVLYFTLECVMSVFQDVILSDRKNIKIPLAYKVLHKGTDIFSLEY